VLIAIAGAHGNIAMRLAARLLARGDGVIGLIRNPDHAAEVQAAGANPVVCDLETAAVEEIAAAVQHAEAVVFAAGAGPGSGAERKLTMDRDGAVKLLEATAERAVPYVIISSVGAENPPDDDDVFSVYLRAKAAADAAVQASDRDWTIVRPGVLTDETGTGRVRIDTEAFRGRVPRDDVADVLAAVLHDKRASHRILYVNAGEDSLDQALARALESR
jgi:nucleoside-diphosphate-sugar epimerase